MTKNNNNNENKAQIISLEDHKQYKERGIYMRDDHCDWGSSGMKEITSENTESN